MQVQEIIREICPPCPSFPLWQDLRKLGVTGTVWALRWRWCIDSAQMHCDTCACVCACACACVLLSVLSHAWVCAAMATVNTLKSSLTTRIRGAVFLEHLPPVLLPTPPSPKPWRQESVLHFYNFVILTYLCRFWVCFFERCSSQWWL